MTDHFRASFDAKSPNGVRTCLSIRNYQDGRFCQAMASVCFEYKHGKGLPQLWGRKNREIGRQVDLIEIGVLGDKAVLDLADQLETCAETLRAELTWLHEQHRCTQGMTEHKQVSTQPSSERNGRAIGK